MYVLRGLHKVTNATYGVAELSLFSWMLHDISIYLPDIECPNNVDYHFCHNPLLQHQLRLKIDYELKYHSQSHHFPYIQIMGRSHLPNCIKKLHLIDHA